MPKASWRGALRRHAGLGGEWEEGKQEDRESAHGVSLYITARGDEKHHFVALPTQACGILLPKDSDAKEGTHETNCYRVGET
jgi:hypothetical protein